MTLLEHARNRNRKVSVDVDVNEALFDASDQHGHQVVIDMAGKTGGVSGRAVAARDLLLMALAGCSGASFLKELRTRGKTIHQLTISVTGEVDSVPPAVFRRIALHLDVTGEDLDDDSMAAAALACHGDCSVHATLSCVAEITTTYRVGSASTAAGTTS